MLSRVREMTDVIGVDGSHYEGEENDETHQGVNDAHGDSNKRMEVVGLRKAPLWYL